MEETTSYYIYRLTLKSFLSEMSGLVSESVLEQIGDYILKHLLDITFVDGNGENTTTFGDFVFGKMGYVTIERKVSRKHDKKDCKEQDLVDEYPDFNLLVDVRNVKKGDVVLAIEYQRKCFVNIDTVRKGLEKHFQSVIGQLFAVDVTLRQISSSEKFWKCLEEKVNKGKPLKTIRLEINELQEGELLQGLDAEKSTVIAALLDMLMDMGADDGTFSFNAKPDKALKLQRAKYHLGMIVALSCKKGFVVKAKFADEHNWVSSEVSAPVIFKLDKKLVYKPDDNDEKKAEIYKWQVKNLTEWFDHIAQELDKIEMEKENEQTRSIAKR